MYVADKEYVHVLLVTPVLHFSPFVLRCALVSNPNGQLKRSF